MLLESKAVIGSFLRTVLKIKGLNHSKSTLICLSPTCLPPSPFIIISKFPLYYLKLTCDKLSKNVFILQTSIFKCSKRILNRDGGVDSLFRGLVISVI